LTRKAFASRSQSREPSPPPLLSLYQFDKIFDLRRKSAPVAIRRCAAIVLEPNRSVLVILSEARDLTHTARGHARQIACSITACEILHSVQDGRYHTLSCPGPPSVRRSPMDAIKETHERRAHLPSFSIMLNGQRPIGGTGGFGGNGSGGGIGLGGVGVGFGFGAGVDDTEVFIVMKPSTSNAQRSTSNVTM
jgi:hypothetical protein